MRRSNHFFILILIPEYGIITADDFPEGCPAFGELTFETVNFLIVGFFQDRRKRYHHFGQIIFYELRIYDEVSRFVQIRHKKSQNGRFLQPIFFSWNTSGVVKKS